MIRIGLYHDEIVQSVAISGTGGEYMIKAGDRRIGTFSKGDILYATLRDSMVSLHDAGGVYGTFKSVELEPLSLNGTFRLRPVTPALESRSYDDGLVLHPVVLQGLGHLPAHVGHLAALVLDLDHLACDKIQGLVP